MNIKITIKHNDGYTSHHEKDIDLTSKLSILDSDHGLINELKKTIDIYIERCKTNGEPKEVIRNKW